MNFMRDPDSVATSSPPTPTGGGDWFRGSPIVHLTDSNFTPEIRKQKALLVMFYAPCKDNKLVHAFVKLMLVFFKGADIAKDLNRITYRPPPTWRKRATSIAWVPSIVQRIHKQQMRTKSTVFQR